MRRCSVCHCEHPEKGRALDGRRCYRCRHCRVEWSEGMQGRRPRYSKQRLGFQFHDTGAWQWSKVINPRGEPAFLK